MLLKSHHFTSFTSKLILFSTFFCFFISLFVSELVLNLIIFSGILSFGVIHGANDLFLLKKNSSTNEISNIKLFVTYLSMVLLCGGFFYFFPSFALIFFVLYSSFHFGEQQWTLFEKKSKSIKFLLLYFNYGLFLFSSLFWINSQQVSDIIFDITGFLIVKDFFTKLLLFSSVTMIFSIVLNFKSILNQIVIQLTLLIILLIFFFNSSLLWGFGVFFIFWHSIPSILEQSNFLFGSFSWISILKYLKYAFFYWVLSLIGLCILYYMLKDYQNLLVSVLFSFLAAITLPHTIVIYKIKAN